MDRENMIVVMTLIISLALVIVSCVTNYHITQRKYIENGYVQTVLPGNLGVAWIKDN